MALQIGNAYAQNDDNDIISLRDILCRVKKHYKKLDIYADLL